MTESNHSAQNETYDSVFISYGRFCITFETAVSRLRSLIEQILKINGLRNQEILQILFANQTAEPLRSLLLPLLEKTRSLTSQEVSTVHDVINRFQRLTEQRNVVIHSTWSLFALGQDDIDYGKLDGFKYVRKKGVNSIDVRSIDVKELDAFTKEAEILADCFLQILFKFGFGEPIDSGFKKAMNGRYLPTYKQYWPES